MAGVLGWGYYVTDKEWLPIVVDSEGRIRTVAEIDHLNDIGDVFVPAPTDEYLLYWDDPNSRWACRALVVADLPLHGAAQHTDVTRELFIPATAGAVISGTVGDLGYFGRVQGAANTDSPNVLFNFKVPVDWISFTSLKVVWSSPAAVGNAYFRCYAHYAASGETYATHTDIPAIGAVATGGANIINVTEPANPLTLASLAVGDYVGIQVFRVGSNDLDTLDNVFNLIGILFTYGASQ